MKSKALMWLWDTVLSDWVPLKGTSGSANVETQSGSVWSYGTWPQYVKYPFSSGSTTLAAALSLTNISTYHRGAFTIADLTPASETIAVTGDYEGGTSGSLVVRQASDGALANAAALGNGTYYFDDSCPLVFDNLDFTKSGTSDTVTITGHLMP